MWAMKALDKVRVRTMTKAGIRDRHAMWATRKNPPDLTGEQRSSLAAIADTNRTLYRAYLLKEQLREVFRVKGKAGRQLLAGWLSWATHSHMLRFAIFYTKVHDRLLRPLLAADQPPAPPPLRNSLHTIDIHVTQTLDQARMLSKVA
jgi:transposase